MKLTIQKPIEVDAKYLQVETYIEDWHTTKVNGILIKDNGMIPCMEDGMWKFKIEIETGKIINWEQGVEAVICCQVVNEHCRFTLQDKDGKELKSIHYPPSDLTIYYIVPFNGIVMSVNKDGFIEDWEPELVDFT